MREPNVMRHRILGGLLLVAGVYVIVDNLRVLDHCGWFPHLDASFCGTFRRMRASAYAWLAFGVGVLPPGLARCAAPCGRLPWPVAAVCVAAVVNVGGLVFVPYGRAFLTWEGSLVLLALAVTSAASLLVQRTLKAMREAPRVGQA